MSKCEFSIDFRLCFSDWAESDKTRSDKTSVRWEGRALPKESNEIFRSKAEHSVGPAEKILSKCAFSVEFCLCSTDMAEIGKTCSDKNSVWRGTRARSGGSGKLFCSKAEHFNWLAEQILSMCGICIEFRLSSTDTAGSSKG